MKGDSHGSLYPGEIHLPRDRVDWNGMKFYPQVRRSFIECSVGGRRNNPEREIRRSSHSPGSHQHFRFGNPFGGTSPITVGLDRHNDTLSTTRSRGSRTSGIVEHSVEPKLESYHHSRRERPPTLSTWIQLRLPSS